MQAHHLGNIPCICLLPPPTPLPIPFILTSLKLLTSLENTNHKVFPQALASLEPKPISQFCFLKTKIQGRHFLLSLSLQSLLCPPSPSFKLMDPFSLIKYKCACVCVCMCDDYYAYLILYNKFICKWYVFINICIQPAESTFVACASIISELTTLYGITN